MYDDAKVRREGGREQEKEEETWPENLFIVVVLPLIENKGMIRTLGKVFRLWNDDIDDDGLPSIFTSDQETFVPITCIKFLLDSLI